MSEKLFEAQNWTATKDVLLEGLNGNKKAVMESVLENTRKQALLESATAGATQTFPVPGLLTTDNIYVIGIQGSQTNGVMAAEADCLTAGVLSIQWLNATGASATIAHILFLSILESQ